MELDRHDVAGYKRCMARGKRLGKKKAHIVDHRQGTALVLLAQQPTDSVRRTLVSSLSGSARNIAHYLEHPNVSPLPSRKREWSAAKSLRERATRLKSTTGAKSGPARSSTFIR
jgi:hypothetical protein